MTTREKNIRKDFYLKEIKYGELSFLTPERAKLYENGDILLLRIKYVDLFYDMIVEDMIKIYGRELNIQQFRSFSVNLDPDYKEDTIFDSQMIYVNSKKCKNFKCRPLRLKDIKIYERKQKIKQIKNN